MKVILETDRAHYLNLTSTSVLLALSVPDEGYSRNGLCALNLIST